VVLAFLASRHQCKSHTESWGVAFRIQRLVDASTSLVMRSELFELKVQH